LIIELHSKFGIIKTINGTERVILLMPISIEEFQQGNVIDRSSMIILDFLHL